MSFFRNVVCICWSGTRAQMGEISIYVCLRLVIGQWEILLKTVLHAEATAVYNIYTN